MGPQEELQFRDIDLLIRVSEEQLSLENVRVLGRDLEHSLTGFRVQKIKKKRRQAMAIAVGLEKGEVKLDLTFFSDENVLLSHGIINIERIGFMISKNSNLLYIVEQLKEENETYKQHLFNVDANYLGSSYGQKVSIINEVEFEEDPITHSMRYVRKASVLRL